MNTETYELLAHGASYWFVILAAIIVVKGIRNSWKDNKKERNLRALSDGSRCIGELIVLEDGIRSAKKSIKGARLLVPEEGLIGSGGISDIQIRHPDVLRRHIWYTYERGALYLKPASGARVDCPMDPDGKLALRDGDHLIIGKLEMMMVFFSVHDAAASSGAVPKPAARGRRRKAEDEYDDPFAEKFWE